MVYVNLSKEPVSIQLEGRFRSVSVTLRPLPPWSFEKASQQAFVLMKTPAALPMLALEAGVITVEDHERWRMGAELETEESAAFLAGLAHWAAVTALADAAIVSWEGLTDDQGQGLPVTKQTVAALMGAEGISDQICDAIDRIRALQLTDTAGARQ